jgi:hypothetical protein
MTLRIFEATIEGAGGTRVIRVPSETEVQVADAAATVMQPGESIVSVREVDDDGSSPVDVAPPRTQAEELAPVTPGAASLS